MMDPTAIFAPPSLGFYVVGYFPYYRNINDISDVKFRMCNVLNYAFFEVNSQGTLTVRNPSLLAAVHAKARANNAKIFMSINDGSGDGTTYFTRMAASKEGRNLFVRSVMQSVRQYDLDGVDVDWEFPTTTNGSHLTFSALMRELSDSLHRNAKYYLSAAIVAGKYAGGVRDAVRPDIFPYVDFFNIMAYDDFNTTVPYRAHSTYALAETCLQYWRSAGIPQAKCVLGIPGYGRPSGITQEGTILSYQGILAQGGNPLLDSAVVSTPSFANYTVYYNGLETVRKKAQLSQSQAGGIMLWELSHDTNDDNSIMKAVCDAIGRAY